MKENSIEEDIKIAENILHKGYTMSILHPSTNIKESEIKAIEHILSDYKRILKENKELNNRCKNLDEEAQAYVEELMGDSTLKDRIINRLNKENEELKNNTRKNENELEFDIDCDWIALQEILDESERSNEYISYKNEKWIKEKYCVPVQKIKDKIRKNEEIIDITNDGDLIHELYQENKVYEELLESEE